MSKVLWLLVCGVLLISCSTIYAGNSDRAGEAGAYELLMNNQARPMGMMGINSANVRGIDALGTNIAGLAFNKGFTVSANYLNWLSGTETSMFGLAFAKELTEGNTLAFNINYLSFGKLQLTQTSNSNILGTFSPYMMNLGLSYARVFGRGVRGGLTVRLINEGISNISATGFSLDGGLQYTTGEKDDLHFGVFVRNLGFPMKFSGDGLTISRPPNSITTYELPYYQRAAKFELPAQFSIGLSKDFFFGAPPKDNIAICKPAHRLSVSGSFIYNSFTPNNVGLGFEYAFKESLAIRAGYLYEQDALDKNATMRAHMGASAGISYDFKMGGKNKKNPGVIEISYNYRPTWVFSGTHNLGITFFGSKYSYCDDLVIEKKVAEVATVAKETKPEKKPEPEIKYITKYDTIIKQAPPKIETVVEYKQVNDMLKNFAGNIEFKTATAILTERGEGALMVIGELMRQYPQSRFKIVGHTDNDGTPENNMRLSKLRAKTVARYLYEFKNIPENSMIVEWYGEEKPIADNSTDAGKQRNRRVEITVSDAKLENMSKMSNPPVESPKPTKPTETKKVETKVEKSVTPPSSEDESSSSSEAAKTPQQELNEIASNLTFKTGTDSLTRFAKKAVSGIVKVLKANPNAKLKIEAHTDNVKYSIGNLDLSNNRAKAIIEQLKAEGIDSSRLSSEGFGDSKPIDTNESEIGRSKNRRIDLKIVN